MSVFPLSPGDMLQIAQWTCDKAEALAFIDRCDALVAETPTDNPFLGVTPLLLRTRRDEIVSAFVNRIAALLADHYQCRVDTWELLKEPPADCDAEAVLALAVATLDGQSVAEAARRRMRTALSQRSRRPWILHGRKLTLPHFLYFYETFDHRFSVSDGQIDPLFNALACWSTGALYADWRLWSVAFPRFPNATAAEWFTMHETPVTAVEGLRYFKNGRVDIIFATAEQARDFMSHYGPASEDSTEGPGIC